MLCQLGSTFLFSTLMYFMISYRWHVNTSFNYNFLDNPILLDTQRNRDEHVVVANWRNWHERHQNGNMAKPALQSRCCFARGTATSVGVDNSLRRQLQDKSFLRVMSRHSRIRTFHSLECRGRNKPTPRIRPRFYGSAIILRPNPTG